MKAIVCTRYGPPEVLQLHDMRMPEPGENEILIKIHATSATPTDCFLRSGATNLSIIRRAFVRTILLGIRRPRNPVLGVVLAGEVQRAGSAVQRFRTGDRVYAYTLFRFGAYAEYKVLPEGAAVAPAPHNLTYDEAASIPYGGLLALYFLRRGGIKNGQRVLIYGASGSVGTSAVQLAKNFGTSVTAICGPSSVDLVRSLGADEIVDYTKNDARLSARYDLVLDAVGKGKTSPLKEECKRALAPSARYVAVDDAPARPTSTDLLVLKDLAESGALRPVIDRRYQLEEMVTAHRYVEQGHKKGNVIVSV